MILGPNCAQPHSDPWMETVSHARWLLYALPITIALSAAHAEEIVSNPSQPVVIHGPVYLHGDVTSGNGRPMTVVPCDSLTRWCGSAEFLLMRANRRGLGYVIIDRDGDADPEGESLSLAEGLEYDAGMRVSLGLAFQGDDRLDFAYTYFSQGTASDVLEPVGGRIWIPVMPPDQAENYTRVTADYDLEINIGDIMYHRSCKSFLGQSNVSAGVRIAKIDQQFDVLGSIGQGGNNPEDRFATQSQFTGAGARVGFGFQRALVGNVHLTASAFGSLVLGRFESSAFLAENANVEIDVSEEFRQAVPVAELEIGGSWYPNCAPGWQLFAGWQQMTFFNLSPTQYFVDDGGNDQAMLVDLSHDLDLSAVSFRLSYAW